MRETDGPKPVFAAGCPCACLRLVSNGQTVESGRPDSLSKTAIFCSCPSSRNWKLSFFKAAIGRANVRQSRDETFTSLTSTLKVVSDSWQRDKASRIGRRLQLPVVSSGKLGHSCILPRAAWADPCDCSPCFSG